MPEVLDRLQTLLGARSDGTFGVEPVFDEDIYDRMFSFITSLEPDQLTEEQAAEIMDIIESIELEYDGIDEEEDDDYEDDEDELNEAPKRVRRNKALRRQRSRMYKRKKAKLKMRAKRYRRSAKGKMMAKKAKRMKKRGRTATGKRIRRFY